MKFEAQNINKIQTQFTVFYLQFIILYNTMGIFFYVLLTVHLSIFISVFNQRDAQNFVLQ
jgi:hypothetical protein